MGWGGVGWGGVEWNGVGSEAVDLEGLGKIARAMAGEHNLWG